MAKHHDKSPPEPEPVIEPKPEPEVEAPVAAEPVAEPVGHEAEPAALAGATPEPTPGLAPPGQGAQVVLTGDAQAAARGGPHGDIVANTQARDAAITAGHVAEGTTAVAAADATSGTVVDELAEDEAEAIAQVKADFAAKRIERAAKPPG